MVVDTLRSGRPADVLQERWDLERMLADVAADEVDCGRLADRIAGLQEEASAVRDPVVLDCPTCGRYWSHTLTTCPYCGNGQRS